MHFRVLILFLALLVYSISVCVLYWQQREINDGRGKSRAVINNVSHKLLKITFFTRGWADMDEDFLWHEERPRNKQTHTNNKNNLKPPESLLPGRSCVKVCSPFEQRGAASVFLSNKFFAWLLHIGTAGIISKGAWFQHSTLWYLSTKEILMIVKSRILFHTSILNYLSVYFNYSLQCGIVPTLEEWMTYGMYEAVHMNAFPWFKVTMNWNIWRYPKTTFGTHMILKPVKLIYSTCVQGF